MKKVKCVPTEEVARELMAEIDDSAYALYAYYVLKSREHRFTFEDENAAEYLGWKLDKVKRNRRKLQQHHWFHQESGKYSGGRKIFTTYLGKDKVIPAVGIENILAGAKKPYTAVEALQLLKDSGLIYNEEKQDAQIKLWLKSGLIAP